MTTYTIWNIRTSGSYEYKMTGTLEDMAKLQASYYADSRLEARRANDNELHMTLTYSDSDVTDSFIITS